jgi:hypothetical protein
MPNLRKADRRWQPFPMIHIKNLFLLLLILSCNYNRKNNQQSHFEETGHSISNETVKEKKPDGEQIINSSDTTSSDYLIYLLKNDKPINNHWTQKLDSLDIFSLPLDSVSRLSLVRDWPINDSISVIILSSSTGTDYDEFLLTIKNKKYFIGKIHIGDNPDSDISAGHPYYYTGYKIVDNRKIRLFNHKVTGKEDDTEKDRLLSSATWVIRSDGRVIKR